MSDDRKCELISQLRDQCLKRGCSGIRGLGVVFRQLDLDYSRRINLHELKNGLQQYGLHVDDNDLLLLFSALDQDENGEIDFTEFMHQLRPPMTRGRKLVITEAFHKLDVNGDGEISVEDLRHVYSDNARQHPMYLSGRWTLDQTLRHFLDALDTPGCKDGKVNLVEFFNFYAGVSSTIDDDSYFDLMMRACYNLPPRTR